MRKEEFLAQLRQGLSCLSERDAQEHVSFYTEMIEDRMEDGLSEEEAVLAVGSVREIVARILTDGPATEPPVESKNQKRQLEVWQIVLLALGAPLWLSLGVAAVSVVLSLYVTVWSLLISLWVVFASLTVCALSGTVAGAIVCVGDGLNGVALIAVGAICAGLSIFMFFGCLAATKGLLALTKQSAVWIKNCFRRKEGV